MKVTRLWAGCLGAAFAWIVVGCDGSDPAKAPQAAAPSSQPTGPETLEDTDPTAQALAAALSEADPYARARRVAELLATLGPQGVPAVEQRLARSLHLRAPEFELLVYFWASHDPSAAAKWAFSHAPRYRNAAIQMAVERWAELDPQAAHAAVAAATVPSLGQYLSDAARLALVRGWFRSDRAGLEKYILGLEATPEREAALVAYALSLQQADGSEALIRWAEAIPDDDPGLKRSVFFETTSALVAVDPEVALGWCEKHCDGPYSVGMRQVMVIARLNHGEDGASIVEWMASAPSTPSNDQTLVASYGIWARRDRDAALAWMQQKIAEGRDAWISKLYAPYARHLAATTPAEAIRWAERVEADAEREVLLVEVAHAWHQQDAAAAEAWLARSPLPEKLRKVVREPDVIPVQAAPAP